MLTLMYNSGPGDVMDVVSWQQASRGASTTTACVGEEGVGGVDM
jgi:hypothetical protein